MKTKMTMMFAAVAAMVNVAMAGEVSVTSWTHKFVWDAVADIDEVKR